MTTEKTTASCLRVGDMLESLGDQVIGKRIHHIDWQTIDARARVAVVTSKQEITLVLQDHSTLLLTPETSVTRSPWEGKYTADSYTEYEVVFEWVEWRNVRAPCCGYFEPVTPARERTGYVLAIDRRGAEREAREALYLVEWADSTTEQPGWRCKSVRRVRIDGPVVLELWEPVPTGAHAGRVKRVSGRALGEIYRDVSESLCAGDLVDEYFSGPATWRSDGLTPDSPWPDGLHLVGVYAVTGGSEGWYVHVDLMRGENIELKATTKFGEHLVRHIRTASTVMLGKTFQGMEHAQKMVAAIAALLSV